MLNSARQWKHFAAMLAIGDGVMAIIHPSNDAEAWAAGPEWWNRSMRFFKRCPTLTRLIGAAQIAGGIWWALSNETPASPSGSDEQHELEGAGFS